MRDPCERVLDALSSGEALDAGLREHAAGCPRCGPLLSAEAALRASLERVSVPPMPKALEEEAAKAGPVRPWSALRRAVGPVFVALLLLLLTWRLIPRPDLWEQLARPLYASHASLLVALSAAGLGLALWRGPSGLGASVASRRLLGAAVFPLLLLSTVATLGSTPSSIHLHRHVLLVGALCAVLGSLVGAVAAVALFRAARRTAVSAPGLTGALLGGAAGLLGSLSLHVHCPVVDEGHCLVAHTVPVLLGLLFGGLLGGRWLKP